MRRYLCTSAIAKLTAAPLMTACDRLKAGRYGLTVRRGRCVFAALEMVEQATGLRFTEAQIEAATEGHPGRVLTTTIEMDHDAA